MNNFTLSGNRRKLYIKNLIFLVLLVYCTSLFAASELVYEKKENQSFIFNFQPGKSGTPAINNYFVRELARRNLSGLYETEFELEYTSWNTIQRSGNNNLRIQTLFEPHNISGDIHYKEVNLSDILMPEFISFRVVVLSDGYFVGSKTFKDVRIENKGFSSSFELESKEAGEYYSIRIEDVSFYSDQKDKTVFLNRTKFIDDYYASVALIEDVLVQLEEQREIEQESMIQSYIRLFELQRVIREIESSGFSRIINIRQEDVAGYSQKLDELKDEYQRLETYFYYLLNSDFDVSSEKEIPVAGELYVSLISRYFNVSEKVSHAFAPYYFEMGKVDFSDYLKHSFEEGLIEILKRSGSVVEANEFIKNFEREVYNRYLEKAENLIQKEQFAIAKSILNNARSVHQAIENDNFSLEMNMMISQADYGIYNSYLKVMNRAIEAGVFNMAETYIEKAWEFQRGNTTSIITDNQLVNLQQQLIEKYLEKGDQYLVKNEFEEAVYCYNRARQNAEVIEVNEYEDRIISGLINTKNGMYAYQLKQANQLFVEGEYLEARQLINRAVIMKQQNSEDINIAEHVTYMSNTVRLKMFDDLMRTGNTCMETGDYVKAYSSYKDAATLKPKNHFQLDDKAENLRQEAAKMLIVSECDRGVNILNMDRIDDAEDIYVSSLKLTKDNNLNQLDEINSILELLDQRITDKKCQDLGIVINDLYTKAQQYRSSGNYIQMMDKLDSCLGLSGENFSCGINESEIYREKAKYKDFDSYQRCIEKSKKALQQYSAQTFLVNYYKMVDLSDNIPLISEEMERYPLQKLFNDRDMLVLLENMLRQFETSENLSALLYLLNALKINGYSAKETMNIQETIGRSLAVKDQTNVFNLQPRSLLKEYTKGDNWFRFFDSAYLQAWK